LLVVKNKDIAELMKWSCVEVTAGKAVADVADFVLALPLFHWVVTSGRLFTHIASPVFSAPRNWGTKGSIRTGPI